MRTLSLGLVLVAMSTLDVQAQRRARCHPSYRGACVPIVDRDLNCEVVWRRGRCNLRLVGDDVYRFDGDGNGIACECISMRYWRQRRHR